MESSNSASESEAPTSKKRYKCPEKGCNASFTKNNKLTYHIRKHTGERPFACDEPGCSKTYTNSSHLTRHKKVNHGEKKSESVMCDYEGCSMTFANKYSLKKHCNRKHNINNYPFTCTECSQGFQRKRQLQEHSYIHTGEAPFKCDKCDMAYTTNYLLYKHRLRHKTYTCECGETFYKWTLMLAHKKLCKRYKCEKCGKKLSTLGNYKLHKLVHVNKSEKMVYVCPYADCNRFYFYKKNIKYHIDIFHKKINANVVYNCTYPNCTAKLKTKVCLKNHLQGHFKWVKKKQRRPRFDKGIPKKPMVEVLTGTKNIKNGTEEVCITENTSDEVLLQQCDRTLTLLKENISANVDLVK